MADVGDHAYYFIGRESGSGTIVKIDGGAILVHDKDQGRNLVLNRDQGHLIFTVEAEEKKEEGYDRDAEKN